MGQYATHRVASRAERLIEKPRMYEHFDLKDLEVVTGMGRTRSQKDKRKIQVVEIGKQG